jgi:UDP:flavonoid glycosyltransferase YjiC (YdhE family)
VSSDDPSRFDVVIAADPRFPGGTSTATLGDARALRRMGLSVALLPVASAVLRETRPPHPRLMEGLAAAGVTLLDPAVPATTDLVLVTHPSLFPHMPARPLMLATSAVVLVANHPPRLGRGSPEYDPAAALDMLELIFGAPAMIAPVSPLVSELVAGTGLDPSRMTGILPRIVDLDEWDVPIRPPEPGRPLRIGRHARPDPHKWPDTAEDILAAWPADRDDVRVDILGGGPPAHLIDHIPWTWQVRPFDHGHPRAFLAGLDAYVSFHSRSWLEAFGMSLLEAMAAGRVVVTHPSFRTLFGDGAVYTTPDGAMAALDRLRADPTAWVAQAEAGRRVARELFSWPAFETAFETIRRQACASVPRPVPPPVPPRGAVAPRRARRRFLMVSSNGTGLGHITRLAAIAHRFPEEADVRVLTLSQGATLVRRFGIPVDFLPSHQAHDIDRDSWNRAFAQEFAAALAYHRPDCVVFDGSVPYAGLVAVLEARPGLVSVWIRRGLWKPGQSAEPLQRAASFTAVLEPGDLAGREDAGPTARAGDQPFRVGPVLLVDPATRMPRAEARAALGLPPDGRIAAIRMGAHGDGERARLGQEIARRLRDEHGCLIVDVRSPLAPATDTGWAPDIRRISAYPLAESLEAFDLVVTEAGYNSFHECVLSGVPTVFVPREEPEMDDQSLRARWAECAGLGLCLCPVGTEPPGTLLARALDPRTAAEIRRRAARLAPPGGAGEAARFIWDLTAMVRAARPLGAVVDR